MLVVVHCVEVFKVSIVDAERDVGVRFDGRNRSQAPISPVDGVKVEVIRVSSRQNVESSDFGANNCRFTYVLVSQIF